MLTVKTVLSGLLLNLALASNSYGLPAVFKDSVLTISEGVVILDGESTYFKNIRLLVNANGSLDLIDADRKQSASVEEIAVAVIETSPLQVEVLASGYQSTPCVELEHAVARVDNTFHVVIAENVLLTLVACADVTVPFDLTIELPVEELPTGNYKVVVHGQELVFSL